MKPHRFTWLIAFWVAVFVTYVPWAEHSQLHYALLSPEISESSSSEPEDFSPSGKTVLKRNKQGSSLRMDDAPSIRVPTPVSEGYTFLFHPLEESEQHLHLHIATLNAYSRAPPVAYLSA